MNGISIPIDIDLSRIRAAIKEIESLGRAMGTLGAVPGMAPQNPQVSAAWQQVQQMQGFGNKSAMSGLPKEIAGLDASTRRIATNLQSWQSAASKARNELKQLQADIKGLEQASLDPKLRASTRSTMLDEIRQLSERKKEVEREAQRAEARAASYERRLPDGWQQHQQQQQQQQNQQDQRGNWSGARRLLGYGMVAAGGFSLGSYISQSRGDYRHSLDYESPLWTRGVRGSRDRANAAAGLGIAPGEMYGLQDSLSRMGLSDHNGIGKHAMLTASFAKSQGVDIGEATKLRENLFTATGNAGELPSSVLLSVGKATADGFDKSRVTMLLQQIEKSTGLSAQAMHGAGLSKQSIAADMAFAMAGSKLDGEKGVFARSQELGNVMQNGLQGAGSPMGDAMLFSAMGGYDGAFTWEKIHKMNRIKQGGFMENPELLNKILSRIDGGSTAATAGKLESFFPQWNLGAKGSETLVEMHKSGFFSKLAGSKKTMLAELEGQAKGGDKQAAQWLQEIKSNPALSRQATEATKDVVRIEAGEKLSKLFEPLELSAAKMADALAAGDWKKSFSVLGDAAGEMGPAAKTMLAAGTLMAAGGILSLGKNVPGSAGLLSKLAPMLLNPVAGGAALLGGTFGAIGYFGASNDKKLKGAQSDKELKDRLSQLEVQGNPNGPEGKRIQEELKRRQSGINRFNGTTTITNADGTTTHRKGSRNWANHNPGNIGYGDFARANGAIGSDGRFAVFSDYQAGRKAKERLLFGENSKYRNLSISDAIERFAPKSENPNNANYKAAAIRAAGGKDVRLASLTPEQREALMNEMERQEGFKPGTEWTTYTTASGKGKPWEVDQSKYLMPRAAAQTIAQYAANTAAPATYATEVEKPAEQSKASGETQTIRGEYHTKSSDPENRAIAEQLQELVQAARETALNTRRNAGANAAAIRN